MEQYPNIPDKGSTFPVLKTFNLNKRILLKRKKQVVKDCGIPVCVLGDASRPSQIYQAMHGAFKAALALGE